MHELKPKGGREGWLKLDEASQIVGSVRLSHLSVDTDTRPPMGLSPPSLLGLSFPISGCGVMLHTGNGDMWAGAQAVSTQILLVRVHSIGKSEGTSPLYFNATAQRDGRKAYHVPKGMCICTLSWSCME